MREYIQAWLALRIDCREVTSLEYALIAGAIVATILVGFNVLATDMFVKSNNTGASL